MGEEASVTYVTPFLPPEGNAIVKRHESTFGQPAFTWAMSQDFTSCPNCGGNGVVYLRLAERGPFKYVPGTLKSTITWYDGDGRFGKGWYIIKETMAFVCPKCKGIRQ